MAFDSILRMRSSFASVRACVFVCVCVRVGRSTRFRERAVSVVMESMQ